MHKGGFLRTTSIYLTGMASILLPASCWAQFSSFNITTFAGNHTAGSTGDGGVATSAELYSPIAVALDPSGNLYIADSLNNKVRKVAPTGKISTLAGNGTQGYTGDGGVATSAELNTPYGLAVDASDNLYIADLVNHVIRKVTAGGTISTFAGNTTLGFAGDGGPATGAWLDQPFGLAIDSAGDVYISDSANNRVRRVTPDGTINTFAGNGSAGYSGDGGPALSASLNAPCGIALDSSGNLYIADSSNDRIRKVAPNGTITTVAGNGTAGFSGDGGLATSAQLNRPFGVAVDAGGDLFIVDYLNSRIRQVTASGVINTVAGHTGFGYSGDGSAATSALMNFPSGLALDPSGLVYIADADNNVIRLLTPTAPAVSGAISADQFGAFTSAAPGSWIEIYGTNLAADARSWTLADFSSETAPAALDGTSVTIGGQSAYVAYISGSQVNVQVPNVAPGTQQIAVKNAGGTGANYAFTVNAAQPGLFAPPSFKINGTQYVVALFADGTYVLPPGAIPGITSRRANPGDIITFYGTGFGPVTPQFLPGQVVQQNNTLTSAFQVFFGQTQATVRYAGLASDYVGLYQINVVVPNISASDAVPLTFTLNGTGGAQTLFTAAQ